VRGRGIVLIAALVAAGCTTAGVTPSETVTTTTPGFTEQWFRVTWDAEPGPGYVRLKGYVTNNFSQPITDVRLLAQALDAAGNVVDQRLQWVGGTIGPGVQRYFEFDRLAAANQYRASVWSHTIMESPPKGFPF